MPGDADWTILGGQLALGTLLGLAVGFTVKKALKVALVLVGVLLLGGLALQHFGFISINWAVIEELYVRTVEHTGGLWALLRGWAESLGALIPVAGSFIVGFLIGLELGLRPGAERVGPPVRRPGRRLGPRRGRALRRPPGHPAGCRVGPRIARPAPDAAATPCSRLHRQLDGRQLVRALPVVALGVGHVGARLQGAHQLVDVKASVPRRIGAEQLRGAPEQIGRPVVALLLPVLMRSRHLNQGLVEVV